MSYVTVNVVCMTLINIYIWMYVWIDGWVGGWMDGWMDGCRMDGWIEEKTETINIFTYYLNV